jgi:hypothetical protein
MKRTLKTISLGILLIGAVSLLVRAADISGTWEMTSQSPRGGERVSEMTIAQDGDTFKITMVGFRGDEMVGDGTIDGNKVKWSFTMETQRGEFTLTYTGTINDDGTMSGEMAMGDRGTMEWTAKKK